MAPAFRRGVVWSAVGRDFVGDLDRYRERAAEMRHRARSAATPELVAIYRELALQWETLAEHVAELQVRSDPWPEPEERLL